MTQMVNGLMFPSKVPIVSQPPAATAFSNTASVSYDGSNEYMNMAVPSLGDTFSVSAWVKWGAGSTGSSDYDYVIAFGANGTRTMCSIARHADTGGNANKPYVFDAGSALVGTNALAIGSWVHVAIVVKPTSGRLTLYVDGSAETIDQPAGDFAISSSTGAVGRLNWTAAHPIIGIVDEVAIWDTNLSSDDITAIWNGGVPNDLTDSGSYNTDRTGNLVGYWRFEEGTGTDVADSSGNGNNGTLINTPTWDTDVPS